MSEEGAEEKPQMRITRVSDSPKKEDVTGAAHGFLDDIILNIEQEGIFRSMGVSPNKTYGLFGKPGCMSGDTIVEVNRAGKSFKIRMDALFYKFNGGISERGVTKTKTSWDENIDTTIRARMEDGYIKLVPIESVLASGVKETFELVTESGKRVRATTKHPFLTPTGWKKLKELKVNDEVLVDIGRVKTGRTKLKDKEIRGLIHHPFARSRERVIEHRLIMEAHLNDLTLESFVNLCKTGLGNYDLIFLNPECYVVHHIDGSHYNNNVDNLKVMSHEQHKVLHGKENYRNVTSQTGPDKIISIEPFGEEETYDIAIGEEPHNFLANGIVVHNTGKTMAISALNNHMNEGVHEKMVAGDAEDIGIDDYNLAVFEYSIGRFGTAYINRGSRTVQDFFDRCSLVAQQKSVLVVLDECDALLTSRTGGVQTHSEDRKVLETIMKNLQILHDTPNMYAVLMSNLPEACDDASLRAGRIDKKYKFNLPDAEERSKAFKLAIQKANERAKYKVVRGQQYETLVSNSEGFSYADIMQTVDEAVRERASEVAVDKTKGIMPAAYITQNRLVKAVQEHKEAFLKEDNKGIGFR